MNETWTKSEKEIARRVYGSAYLRECKAIAEDVRRAIAGVEDPAELWKIHDLLTKRRRQMDEKYDFRYSVLVWVLGRLVREGWITEEEVEGLSADKLATIKEVAAAR